MPHKRAKRSIREEQRTLNAADQAPSKSAISTEAIPKSVSRILNAASVREQFQEKKRKIASGEDTGEKDGRGKKRQRTDSQTKPAAAAKDVKGKGKALGIQPGESLAHFNRRVEVDMRPLVAAALQTSSAQSRKVKKTEIEERAKAKAAKPTKSKAVDEEAERSPSPSPVDKFAGRATEFQKISTSAPRRLNDIAQAPPEFKKLPRGAKEVDKLKPKGAAGTGKEGVLSMAQKLMMEEEREKVIARYRALKERRRAEGGVIGDRDNGDDDDE
ncbi:hypothetical protein FIBSPDRAFT_964448 [Athelia psychrophila]|uniref:Uncharacterized protein n=1 Tax=Athelia psychrophila TaxID=1759441 RepID=A0A165XR48_9AGAM|nr:hypothetical protein FIBSPDRAFT_964448 [Fibularhizoctonia sp. CBS 109695]